MPNFHYTALDRNGKKIRSEIQASSESLARKQAKDRGHFVIKMGSDSGKMKFDLFRSSEISSIKVPGKDLVFFTRQLGTLLKSGFTLDGALATISEQITHSGFHSAILDVDRAVKEGKTLYEALNKYPYIFDETFRSLVRAGEASGELPSILSKLAMYLEEQAKLKNKMLATLTYPAVMIIASIGVIIVLMTQVVPNITSVLLDQGKELPTATAILIKSSNFLTNWWWLLLVLFFSLFVFIKQYYRTKNGRYRIDGILLKLPLFGELFQKIAISRFASTFAVLLRSGVDILKSMSIVKEVVGNVVLQEAISHAAENVGEGNSIAEPLQSSGVFPPIVIKMIDTGQRSGNLEMMLETVASDYDNEVENTILGLTSIIEPLIILVMGGFVCFIVVAILVPMQDMANL